MNIQEALLKPNEVFSHPRDVLNDESLTNEKKKKILENWKQFCTHCQESTGEGMFQGSKVDLSEVNKALILLKKRAS